MRIDVVRYGIKTTLSLASVPGITYFKKEYYKWFEKTGDIYIRYVGKNLVGTWRYVPNKSTEFYRCPRVTSPLLIEKLNRDFITSVIRIYDKGKKNESL